MAGQKWIFKGNQKVSSFLEIQAKVYELGAKIGAPFNQLRIYNSPQPDGTPYIQINSETYYYVFEERGFEFERRATENEDQLCYWIMERVIFLMASRYELSNRIEGQDSRRILFLKELELMKMLSYEWYIAKNMELEEILKNSPFID